MPIIPGARFRRRRENASPCGALGTCWVCLADLTPVNITTDEEENLSFCSIECMMEYWKCYKGKYQAYRPDIM